MIVEEDIEGASSHFLPIGVSILQNEYQLSPNYIYASKYQVKRVFTRKKPGHLNTCRSHESLIHNSPLPFSWPERWAFFRVRSNLRLSIWRSVSFYFSPFLFIESSSLRRPYFTSVAGYCNQCDLQPSPLSLHTVEPPGAVKKIIIVFECVGAASPNISLLKLTTARNLRHCKSH